MKTDARLALFNVRRLAFNLLFWTALFTFILGVRYYDIGNIAFINLPVQIPTSPGAPGRAILSAPGGGEGRAGHAACFQCGG